VGFHNELFVLSKQISIMARRAKKKGSKIKAKPLPIEIDREEYIELLYAMKYLRHRIALILRKEF